MSDSNWREANPSSIHLGELNLNGSLHLAASSAAISLGSAFAPGSAEDLTFQFHAAGMGTLTGWVEYEDGVVNFGTTPGGYNGDGVVDAGDYVVWRKNQGTTNTFFLGFADGLAFNACYPAPVGQAVPDANSCQAQPDLPLFSFRRHLPQRTTGDGLRTFTALDPPRSSALSSSL